MEKPQQSGRQARHLFYCFKSGAARLARRAKNVIRGALLRCLLWSKKKNSNARREEPVKAGRLALEG